MLLTRSALGCGGLPVAECAADERPADAQSRWQMYHPTDYQFIWQQQCFCLPDAVQPIRVTVNDGTITGATDLTGKPVSGDIRKALMSIDALYEYIRNGERAGAKVDFQCTGTGIPARVFIDPDAGVADDEFDVTISEFAVLQ